MSERSKDGLYGTLPFGTIKRQWGFDHIITKKGIHAANADFGFVALAYNLKRLIKLGWKPKNAPIPVLKMLETFCKTLKKQKTDLFIDVMNLMKTTLFVTETSYLS